MLSGAGSRLTVNAAVMFFTMMLITVVLGVIKGLVPGPKKLLEFAMFILMVSIMGLPVLGLFVNIHRPFVM